MNRKNEKDETKKKLITAVIVISVIVALFWVANLLAANIDFVELIRKLHGG